MATLPRLPAKFRGFAGGAGSSLLSPSQQIPRPSHFQTAPQGMSISSPTGNKSTFSRKSAAINYQLQGIRDAALKKYEAYNSQLRQMDRNFHLEVKRAEQQSTRNLSRFADTISALSSEMSQLSNQSSLLQNKIEFLRNKQHEAQSSGVSTIMSPLQHGFDVFGKEFDGALTNINTLFSNLSTKVKLVQKDYDSLQTVKSEISNLDDSTNKLVNSFQNNSNLLLSVHSELDAAVNEQKKNVLTRLQNRMIALRSRIESLEQSSIQSLNKSQNVVADAQTSQYEMRELFDNQMNSIVASFKAKMADSKKAIFDLQQNRFEQIDNIHSRISKTSENLAKMRRKKLKNAAEAQTSNRQSLQSEIDDLTKSVEKLEKKLNKKLAAKGNQQQQQQKQKAQTQQPKPKPSTSAQKQKKKMPTPKNGIRMFININKEEQIKIILVDEKGYVIC